MYDTCTVLKQLFGSGLFLLTCGLPLVLPLNKVSFVYVFIYIVILATIFVLVILPRLKYKTLWQGDGKFKEYRLIRAVGKFRLIKDGVFGNFTIIEDKNKDGVPDSKVDKHFMGRFGYWTYYRELEDVDYQAFHEAMKVIK